MNRLRRVQCPHSLRCSPAFLSCIATVVLILACTLCASAYSVLTHEAIIDSSWETGIRPLLLARFPNATPEELKTAHGFAYGGCAIQDLGYYPTGNKFFSDLVHYIRTGDFIESLLQNSHDINEYAFALGAVAHYAADNNGHRIAVNHAVPILYPKLRRKFGDVVTYSDSPVTHLKTEFAFDVLQVARGHYASDAYRADIGFQVPRSLLERAFRDTYSLDVNEVFSDFDRTIGTYRHAVSTLIPKATRLAWQIKKGEIEKTYPGITREKFLYHISRMDYRKQWNEKFNEPGFGTKIIAFVIRWVPKVGPRSGRARPPSRSSSRRRCSS